MKSCIIKTKYFFYKRHALTAYNFLIKNQYRDIDYLRNESIKKRDKLIGFAFSNIPFYKKRYSECGFELGDQQQSDYFERLPVLTKKDLRSSFDEIVYTKLRSFAGVSTTGGSTGVPTKVLCDMRIPVEAYRWRMQDWWGVKSGDDGAYVWRMRRTKPLHSFANKCLWWPTKKLCLDASFMSEESISKFVNDFNRVRPSLLQGYVGATYEVALYIRNNNISVFSPRAIWVTSSPVSKVQMTVLEEVFNAPVYDQYGCCEASHIAAECSAHQGLHVNSELNFLEFVDSRNKNVPVLEWGNALITKLDDYVFPLIRYEVGDVGRYLKGRCPCGVSLPLIDHVKGRVTDVIRLKSGKLISGDHLTTIFDGVPDLVEEFQVIQHSDYSVSVRVVPSGNDGANLVKIKGIVDDFAKKIDFEVEVKMEVVDHIQHDKGKIRFVVSELK